VKSIVVFLSGIGLHLVGVFENQEDLRIGGAIMFGLGLISMFVSFINEG
jgi:hypothetical membrane protein